MESIEELRAAIRPHAGGPSELDEQHVDAILELIRTVIREDLMGQKQLRERFDKKQSALSMQVWRGKGPPLAGKVGIARVWLRPDVEDWIRENPSAVRHDSHVEGEAS